MSAEDRFKEIIEESDAFDLLVGGVYTFTELGQTGFVPKNSICAAAFDTTHGFPQVKPSLVIRVRQDRPTYQRSDTDSQWVSHDGTVELWYYQFSAYDVIQEASESVKSVLNLRVFSELGLVRLLQQYPGLVAVEFDNTSLHRDDYQFKRTK